MDDIILLKQCTEMCGVEHLTEALEDIIKKVEEMNETDSEYEPSTDEEYEPLEYETGSDIDEEEYKVILNDSHFYALRDCVIKRIEIKSEKTPETKK
jgi:hypothetical protein